MRGGLVAGRVSVRGKHGPGGRHSKGGEGVAAGTDAEAEARGELAPAKLYRMQKQAHEAAQFLDYSSYYPSTLPLRPPPGLEQDYPHCFDDEEEEEAGLEGRVVVRDLAVAQVRVYNCACAWVKHLRRSMAGTQHRTLEFTGHCSVLQDGRGGNAQELMLPQDPPAGSLNLSNIKAQTVKQWPGPLITPLPL